MELPIKVDKKAKFRWIIEVISGQAKPRLTPFCNLRPREKDVLALLYYYKNELKSVPEEYRNTILFSADTKKRICEDLKNDEFPDGISIDNLYNILMALKKHGLLQSNPEKLTYPISDMDSIVFKFIEE